MPLLTDKQYDLPKQARAYIEFIGEFVGVPVGWVGTGPAREDMIVLHGAEGVLA
jgi:adenylosuccinate synthase